MIIYRAMCKAERDSTIQHRKPIFATRFKWFSHNLDWIRSRVCDGQFNNSKYKTDRYAHILAFNWTETNHDFMSNNEIQFDRRRNPTIKFIKELT